MDKRERVERAFRGEEVDHVPVAFWRHFVSDMERGEDIVDATLKYLKETDQDFLKIQGDGFYGYPVKTLQNLNKPEELFDIEYMSEDDPFFRDQVDRVKRFVQRVQGEVVTIYSMFLPLAFFRLQVGWDKMMECMRENPEATMHAIDVIADVENKLIDALINEAGADGVFLSAQNAEKNRFTIEEYDRLVRPSDLKVLNHAASAAEFNVLHCCGWDADLEGTSNHLEKWRDYPLPVVSWASYVDNIDTKGIRELFPGKTAWGGFDNRMSVNPVIYTGTEKEVKAETLRLIEASGKKQFMLGADCSIQCEIDPQRIRWIVEASRSV